MRILMSYTFLLFSLVIRGQSVIPPDTIRINEIFISGNAVSAIINGYRSTKVDTSVIRDHYLDNISEIISEGTPLFVKSYGPGGVATISFRGTGASHTQVLWNDLSINSPMLGQADLSLLPGGFIDDIRVFSGGASMAAGNGGLGGLLTIETKPDWNRGNSFMLNAGSGSFGKYSGLLKIRAGGKKMQSVTRLFSNSEINDFPFINYAGYSEPVKEYRRNSEVRHNSLMQEFYFRGKKGNTTASAWYNYLDRNLPSGILVPQDAGSENQLDHSLRTVINHNRYIGNGGFETTVAWFSEYLRYVNSTASVDSRNRANTIFLREVLEIPAGKKFDLKFMLLDEVNMVNTTNYGGYGSRNLLTMSASARREIGERLGFVVLFRELLLDDKFISPDYSAALDVEIIPNSGSFLKMNLSKNSRVPSMNDLFWIPGGNPDLMNEYSYNGEVSLELRKKAGQGTEMGTDIVLYSGRIRDMIQWKPGDNSYWTPVNIASVGAYGIETGFSYVYSTGRKTVKMNIHYAFNRSRSLDIKESRQKQLIYVPEHQLNGSVRTVLRNFSAGLTGSYTGKRYTTADNSSSLPGYTLVNFNAGYSFRTGRNIFDIAFRADNLLNKQYEVIAWYPMPGRSFLLSLTWQFSGK